MENLFSKRFLELLKNSNMTYDEIAKKLDLKSKGTISKYAKGNINVNINTIIKIANLFEVSPVWLSGLDINVNMDIDSCTYLKVPIIDKINPNIPIDSDKNTHSYTLLKVPNSNQFEYFALKILDDSMFPNFIKEDTLIVKKDNSYTNGDICVIYTENSEVLIRKVSNIENGIILNPINSTYSPIVYSNRKLKDSKIKILGIVEKSERIKIRND